MELAYRSSIHHDGSPRYVRTASQTALRIGDEITLRLRTAVDSSLEGIFVRTCPDGEQFFAEMKPAPLGSNPGCRWWESTLRINMPVTSYRFLLVSSDGVWWYNGTGLHRHVPTDAEDFRLLANYDAPVWVRDSVFYQIFPDRFADGDPASNVQDGEFEYQGLKAKVRAWEEPQSKWPQAMVEFYGGDLPGVEAHLDYLTDLGINAIYLNPIFTAYSNHRYDVIDYENVDPHLGGNEALGSLRRALTERDMRCILDIVPNHCGVMHPWFQSAVTDPAARSAEFFTFHHHPDDYESWLGVRSLPKLNYRSVALRDAMYGSPQSVFRRWLKEPYSIDGWRVDVANMLARHGKDQLEAEVWLGIREAVKSENPQAYLLGENFFDSTRQLQGDQLDAAMNYAGFTNPLLYWLDHFEVNQHAEPRRIESKVPWPTEALVASWQAYRSSIPWVLARQQFNLLGSHDTPRIAHLVGGDAARNRLAVGLLFTYVGVPSVYYGDEIGMNATNALEARDPMIWNSEAWNQELRSFYRRLIQLRRTSPALIEGGFQVLASEQNVLAFLRDTDSEQILVICNRGPEERSARELLVRHGGIPDGSSWTEIFSGQTLIVQDGHLPLPALPAGIQIWRTIT